MAMAGNEMGLVLWLHYNARLAKRPKFGSQRARKSHSWTDENIVSAIMFTTIQS